MHLGNDIVDFAEEKELHNPRFPRRILCDEEYMTYRASQAPKEFLWKAWSAKEAGYKLMKQIDPSCTFVPAEFIYNHEESTVTHRFNSFQITHNLEAEFVYCRAHHGDGTVIEAVRETEEALTTISAGDYDSDLSEESNAARALLKLQLTRQIKCKLSDIEIKKNNDDIPEVYINNKKHDCAVSMSHHGRFVAVAIGI